MRLRIDTFVLTVFFAVLSAPVSAAEEASGSRYSVLPKVFEEAPNDPVKQQRLIYDFIWRSFIALNWPNEPIRVETRNGKPTIVSGLRGKPDPTIPLSALGPKGAQPLTVWETYKEPFEVFPPPECWDERGVWNSVRPRPPTAPAAASNSQTTQTAARPRPLLAYPIDLTGYATDMLQPYFFPYFTGPLYDRNNGLVRYEVAVNRAFFRYVRHFRYYNAAVQRKAVREYIEGTLNGQPFQRPPFGNRQETGPGGYLNGLPDFQQTGFVDLKAAWRVLDTSKPQETARYLRRDLVVGFNPDGSPQKQMMGLVALHILRWTPNGYDPQKNVAGSFIASTFEQIDNVTANVDRAGVRIEPTFNDGRPPNQEERTYGFAGDIPKSGEVRAVNIYRADAQALPPAVVKINQHYQNLAPVKNSVLQFYQLIGTQNKHLGPVSFDTAAARETNGPQGPVTGQITNANNLVNSALESYTQKNFACILCHIKARPFGVIPSDKPGMKQMPGVPDKAFQDDTFKILSFLLQSATEPPKPGEPEKLCVD